MPFKIHLYTYNCTGDSDLYVEGDLSTLNMVNLYLVMAVMGVRPSIQDFNPQDQEDKLSSKRRSSLF